MRARLKGAVEIGFIMLAAATLGLANNGNMPPPGTLNYVEGQVSVQGQPQSPKSVGSTYLEPNQTLSTGSGNAEMLMTPGVYLRIGHNSAVRMISPDLANTQVQLTQGTAMLEVDELFKENDVSMVVDGATTRVEKNGLYEFNASQPSVKVLDGKAVAYEGDERITLKKGHEALLAQASGAPLVRTKFDKEQVENDPLYRWSKLRSDYATESNVAEGNALMDEGGWWGPGWYWDPLWYDFAFMPGWGLGWGPFGYPFFSPWAVAWAPYYGFGFGYGGYAGHYHYPVAVGRGRALPALAHQPVAGSAGFRALPRSAPMGGRAPMGGFRGGAGFGGFHGPVGGFHGAAGGFHGGFGGGFHGGGFHGGR